MIVVRTIIPDEIPQAIWPAIEAVLDLAEQARAARFATARHRREFVAAHALKRIMLSQVAPTTAPPDWSFVTGPHGKPAVSGGTDLHFNISHCDGMVACALRHAAPVGLDLERLDCDVPLEIVGRYFAPVEQEWLLSQPETLRLAAFRCLWTLKEAVIKAAGMGLALELDRFAVSVEPPMLIAADATLGDLETWRLHQRMINDRHLLALAWQEEGSAERLDVAMLAIATLMAG